MNNYQEITSDEFERLLELGVAALFDCPSPECGCTSEGCGCDPGFGGFFDHQPNSPQKDILLICTNAGYFIAPYEDLRKSEDGVFVALANARISPENEEPLPNVEDVFEIQTL